MNRLMRTVWKLMSSRAVPPVVIGFFLILYIGIAFLSDEALTTLMALTRRSFFLAAILALLPLNSVCRIVVETGRYLTRRRCMADAAANVSPGLFDERSELPASPSFSGLEGRLHTAGYRTRRSGTLLAAWKGVSLYPARIFFLVGTLCLFTGILISVVGRTSYRGSVIEGEPFPGPSGGGGIVERIRFGELAGPILARDLVIEVAPSGAGDSVRKFGLYPPSLYHGAFVYPRYLGIALQLRFSAPDLPAGYDTQSVLSLYPPGKEAAVKIPGTSYKLTLILARPEDGSDPYTTGRMDFLYKLLKGNDVLLTGTLPTGSEFVKDGYRLAFPAARRMVLTDFITDYGVFPVAAAVMLFLIAGGYFLPVRLFMPRREMMFVVGKGGVLAASRSEGRARRHNGIFHDALDFLESGRNEQRSSD